MLACMHLIIDTDIALGAVHDGRPRDVDDAYALVAALNNPAIDLLGITTVFGNAPLADTDAIAREIVAMKGSAVPVAMGAEKPLSPHGPDTNDAVEFMADVLTGRSAHIAAIGPLTNLGLLARRYPERLANAASVVIVGGRTAGNRFMLHGKGPVNDFKRRERHRSRSGPAPTRRPRDDGGFRVDEPGHARCFGPRRAPRFAAP